LSGVLEREVNGRGYVLRFDEVDVDAAHAYLRTAYWCEGIPRETVARAIRHSLCLALWCEGAQVGLARVITDRATFAYLCDVYVLEAHRRQGLADWMIETLRHHPDLQGLRRQLLFTRDMHPLYSRHGYVPLAAPERGMEIVRHGLYLAPQA
jgi:GNAT superfamily N-acetyltransferase